MKKLTTPFIFYSCFLMVSCGASKLQLMQTEQFKTANTLLETKEKLAVSIRALNKFLDSRAAEQQIYQDSLIDLSTALNLNSTTLDSVIKLQKGSREKAEILGQQLLESANTYQKKIVPFVKFQRKIRQQQRNLSAIHRDLKTLLDNSPGIKYELILNKNDVTVILENFFLYQSKKYFLTENGRWVVFLIGEVLNKKSSIATEIILFPTPEDKENWDLLSSRGMTIHDRLREKGIGDSRIKTTNMIETKREQTVLVLSYPISDLLKLLPSR